MECSPLLARMLGVRGITSPKKIDDYLHPNLDRDWLNPYEIDGMEDVANSVENAIKAGKRILVYGDYDVDGITATCVVMNGLMKIDEHINSGMSVDYFLPSRFDEGYGFTEKSVDRLLSMPKLPDLIISVDCGITAAEEIKTLQDAGIEIVITDHHSKSSNYPVGVAIIDPEAESTENPNSILSGVGVALKLIQVLGGRLGMPNLWRDYIDLATLGTLADVMPLVGQNRSLIYEGLQHINENPRPAIRALLDIGCCKLDKLTSKDVSYVLTPRLNSAGRMNNANLAVDLLMSKDYSEAYNFALELENLNNQRRQITDDMVEQAKFRAQNIINNKPETRSLVLYSNDWHQGVLGIVSAKVAETYGVPCIVLSNEDKLASGSGRSVGSINLHEACMRCFDKYIKFGGHSGACGLTIDIKDINEFADKLEQYMQKLDSKLFEKTYETDIDVQLYELDVNNVEDLSLMEPFGNMNEEPRFLTKNVFIKRAKAVGQENNHLSCNITDGAYGGQGIMFNVDNISKYLKCDCTVDVVYNPKVDEFHGKKSVKMYIKAFLDNKDESNKNIDNECCDYINNLFCDFNSQEKTNASVGDFINVSVNELQKELIDNKKICNVNRNPNKLFNREKFTSFTEKDVQKEIVSAMIGLDGRLHSSQQESLDELSCGNSLLSVMPTGRGKSLIFQVYAATQALKYNKTSIFVYPLRALISDQAFHLEKSLGKFGLVLKVLNGETSQCDRQYIYNDLKNGKIDIILTTPEYIAIHIDEISNSCNVGFIVIDEAHHMGQVKIGDRTAYGHMPIILEKLNNPQVLALSATVDDDICSEIQKFLPINKIIKDNFERENLYIDDRRNIKCRDDYLVSLCASDEKIVVYVNSRQQTVDLARMIKSRAPHVAMKVGFYNAGMSKDDRKKIESLFRDNKLRILVATSAFGEGVNIPDIRHVCLYHLPFSNVEFNQMAGRCGRDNNPAIIHLLYNRADATINTKILDASNPSRDDLGKIYLWIKNCINNSSGTFEICNNKLINMYQQHLIPCDSAAVMCAFDVFVELELINIETYLKDGLTYSKISLNEHAEKVDLESSSRFCEGQNEVKNFEVYRYTAMRKTADELTELFRHPILPEM